MINLTAKAATRSVLSLVYELLPSGQNFDTFYGNTKGRPQKRYQPYFGIIQCVTQELLVPRDINNPPV